MSEFDFVDEEVMAILVDDSAEMKSSNSGLIVSGEASESEEEEINLTDKNPPSPPSNQYSEPKKYRKVFLQDLAKAVTVDLNVAEKPVKYNSLLHKKLRDKNSSLHRNLTAVINRPLDSAINGISNATQQLIKTQIAVQDLSPMLRQMTNKLFHLEDKIDFLRDYTQHLPEIRIK